jgi:hypothetical protein
MSLIVVLSSLALLGQVAATWFTYEARTLMSRRLWTPLFTLNILLCLWCGLSAFGIWQINLLHHVPSSALGVGITFTMLMVVRRFHRQLQVQQQKVLELAKAAQEELAPLHTTTPSLALNLAHYFIARKGIINGNGDQT